MAKSDSTFVVVSEPHRIGFDCHDFDGIDGLRDEWRDAVILATNGVDVIYRFREADLRMHLPDCLYVASLLDPQIFSNRGRINLRRSLVTSFAIATTAGEHPSLYGPPGRRAVMAQCCLSVVAAELGSLTGSRTSILHKAKHGSIFRRYARTSTKKSYIHIGVQRVEIHDMSESSNVGLLLE